MNVAECRYCGGEGVKIRRHCRKLLTATTTIMTYMVSTRQNAAMQTVNSSMWVIVRNGILPKTATTGENPKKRNKASRQPVILFLFTGGDSTRTASFSIATAFSAVSSGAEGSYDGGAELVSISFWTAVRISSRMNCRNSTSSELPPFSSPLARSRSCSDKSPIVKRQ